MREQLQSALRHLGESPTGRMEGRRSAGAGEAEFLDAGLDGGGLEAQERGGGGREGRRHERYSRLMREEGLQHGVELGNSGRVFGGIGPITAPL